MKVAGYWRLKGTLYRLEGIPEPSADTKQDSNKQTETRKDERQDKRAMLTETNEVQESTAA